MSNLKRNSKNSPPAETVFGKVPPHAVELEKSILGACMLERGAFDVASEILPLGSFYLDAHNRVFRAMYSLRSGNKPIDLLTVAESLRKSNEIELVGGAYYLTVLTQTVVSSANVESHSRLVLEKHIKRELIRLGGDMCVDGYNDGVDVFDLLNQSEANLMDVSKNLIKSDFKHISSSVVEVVKSVEYLRNNPETFTGVPTGYEALDRITHGWQPTDLIILAARPSVGKTALALNMARNAALSMKKPTPVGFFSLEMSSEQLTQRMISAESRLWLNSIQSGRLNDDRLRVFYDKGVKVIGEAPIYIDDAPALNVFELRAKARRMMSKHGVGMIIVDYLQLMTDGTTGRGQKNREQEISTISRSLKMIAKELGIPIIALSQLSREVEKRGKGQKIPQLSDLRESGAIEQDADVVMFIYRPPADEVKLDPDLQNTGMIRIAKHRNGDLDDIAMKFYPKIQLWLSPEDAEVYEGKSAGFPGPLFPVEPVSVNDDDDDIMPF